MHIHRKPTIMTPLETQQQAISPSAPITDISAMEREVSPVIVAATPDKVEPVSVDVVPVSADNVINRSRRTHFIFVSVFACYASVMLLAFYGSGKLAELASDSLSSFMLIMGVTYVTAHSVDRSDILGKIGEGFGRKYVSSQDKQ